jgi:hypothetical protein
MKNKLTLLSLIFVGCFVSIQAQVVKNVKGSAGAPPLNDPLGLYLNAGTSSIKANANVLNLNVGIGTATPTAPLEVVGDLKTTRLVAYNGLFNNYVGIGVSSPSERLDVLGNVKVSGSITSSGLIQGSSITSSGSIQGTSITTTGNVNGGNGFFTGNVGVGTPSSPLSKFQVEGDISSTGSNQRIGFYTYDKFTNAAGTIASYGMSASRNPASELIVSHSGYLGMNFYSLGTERMRITKEGDISIGNVAPHARLQVEGDISSTGPNQRIGFSTYDKFTNASGAIAHYGMSMSKNTASQPIVSHSGYFGINFFTVGLERMRITDGGNIGIGSLNPDEKLTVSGTIHATEVKVTQNVPADYVFEKYYLGKSSLKPDYTLLTLSEVEKFTEANHHLPNVPSAKEIKENGLLLGEMSNVLLQKIEELTLYSIEQQKTIEKLEKENEAFKKLESRLATIETALKKFSSNNNN